MILHPLREVPYALAPSPARSLKSSCFVQRAFPLLCRSVNPLTAAAKGIGVALRSIGALVVLMLWGVAQHASAASLISYYSFDSAPGLTDQGPGNNDGTAVGGAAVTTTAGQFKLGDGALSLDGVDDYVSINSLLDDISTGTDFSVTAWFRTPSSDPQASIILSANEPNNYLLGLDADAQVLSHAGVGIATAGIGVANLDDDTYHFVAVAYNATTSTHTIYVDNALQGTKSPFTVDWDTAAFAQIGMERDGIGPSNFWFGFIDDLAVFEGELTAGEVNTLWNGGSGLAVPELSTALLLGSGLLVLAARRRRLN